MEAGNIDTSSSSSGSLEHVSSEIMVIAIITLFMVIVFFIFFHLYARWSRGREAADETSPRARRRRFVFNFAPTQDPLVAVHKGLEPSLLRDLPVLIFHPDNFKQGLECAVCLSELEDGDTARLLPSCNHGFHVDCIDMWFQSHSTCPLCRSTVGESNPQFQSLHHHLGSGYSIESPDLPTGLEQPIHSSSSSSTSRVRRVQFGSPNGSLVIEIPSRRLTDHGFNSLSSSTPASRFSENEVKSPMTIPLRSSLMRLLSWEKMVIRCSPSLVDVEQGGGGGGQSSITSSETSS